MTQADVQVIGNMLDKFQGELESKMQEYKSQMDSSIDKSFKDEHLFNASLAIYCARITNNPQLAGTPEQSVQAAIKLLEAVKNGS